MSKDDDELSTVYDLLYDQMNKVQDGRKKEKIIQQNSNLVETVKSLIEPIIQAFIKGDRSLVIQAIDSNSFYLAYGYSHVCRISCSEMTDSEVGVSLQNDSGSTVYVYSGSLDKTKIQDVTKDALLTWYKSIF